MKNLRLPLILGPLLFVMCAMIGCTGFSRLNAAADQSLASSSNSSSGNGSSTPSVPDVPPVAPPVPPVVSPPVPPVVSPPVPPVVPPTVPPSPPPVGVTTTTLPPLPSATGLPAPIANLNYAMTFDDEFSSLSTISASNVFDGSKWYNGVDQCCMGDSTGLPGVMYPTVFNGISVNPYSLMPGGGLNLTLSKQNKVWYSGILASVDSKGKGFSQQYGYFEFKAKLPPGPSTWPSFWMLNTASLSSQASVGEIDIFEQFGQFPINFCTTLHDWTAGTTPYYNCKTQVANMETSFHKWGFLWTASTMTLYFDDVQVLTTPTPAVMKQPYFMLIDLGVGGGWPTDQTPSTNVMQVQYVRVYSPQ